MCKFKIKSEKGITLATLVITVMLLIVVTAAIARHTYTSMQVSRLAKLQNDIEQLNDRVAAYYVANGKLPIDERESPKAKGELSSEIKDMSVNDGENYYTIQQDKLDNLSLNYGKGETSYDIYLINEKTHVIYYYEGIEYDGKDYHTIGSYPAVTE